MLMAISNRLNKLVIEIFKIVPPEHAGRKSLIDGDIALLKVSNFTQAHPCSNYGPVQRICAQKTDGLVKFKWNIQYIGHLPNFISNMTVGSIAYSPFPKKRAHQIYPFAYP
jgi:hypothetical protein